MNCIVRKAELNDRDAIFALVEHFAVSFPANRVSFQASFNHLLSDETACLLVVEQDSTLIGYCLGFDHFTFYANGRVSWVEEIMMKPDFRRQNVGRALMEAFEQWAKSRGAVLVALATRRAASFYAALGYEESATYFRKIL